MSLSTLVGTPQPYPQILDKGKKSKVTNTLAYCAKGVNNRLKCFLSDLLGNPIKY